MYDFLVTTSKGLDELLASEIKQICSDVEIKTKPGQVLFRAELEQGYKVCLWSRLANRVLLKLAEDEIANADQLYKLVSSINWTIHFDCEDTFLVDFVGTNQQINNSQFGALKVKDAIVDQFNELYEQRPSVSKESPDIRIQARLWRQNVGIFLDLSGSSLHQRHYRQKTGVAPLKEHLACAMLIRSGWTENMTAPLVDPMCGSGTVVTEAVLMASRVAPGLNRNRWGFDRWKMHDSSLWNTLCNEAESQIQSPEGRFFANDIDKGLVAIAKRNAEAAGVFKSIQFSCIDATKLTCPINNSGYLVTNPPYGERLSEITQLLPLFQQWGLQIKAQFKEWKMSILTSNRELLRQLKLLSRKEYQLMNGKLPCQLVNYVLDEKNCEIKEHKQNSKPTGDFANRLTKNVTRLSKWLKKQNTNCYRVYDADLPEYNVAIDVYGDWVVVQEYAAPKDIPEQKMKRRLHDVLVAVPSVLNVSPDNVILKVRSQQKGKSQYERVSAKKEFVEVYENGAKFLVNLKDYLDTGLFLDHRITRQKIQQLSRNCHVLNLFAYTGSVSVHAALGGASSVTTVDMSNTYLDWSKRNFELNGLKGAFEFVLADCLEWLANHNQQYDLLFIDPPSFSNSKRMDGTWDVQRDHISLLTNAKKCLKDGGKIIFSNNLRQFKLNQEAVSALGLKIENISQQTLPEDFKRNPKIHHCWILSDVN